MTDSDLEDWLARHPDIDSFELLIPDLTGILRGKRLRRSGIARAFESGIQLPGSVYATDATGESVTGTGLVWSVGDADKICRPIARSLAPVPWARTPTAQALISMREDDGSPFTGDPRAVLEAVVARYHAKGWRPVVAVELEFFLVERRRLRGAQPSPARSPQTGAVQTTTQVYGMDELADFEDLFADLDAACRAQGLPADTATAEYAPSQFEINLDHVDDPVLAADHAVMLKRAIKGTAVRHGIDATFMAKPWAGETGSGMHVHASVVDASGNNIFAEEEGGDPLSNPNLRHAVGGLGESLSDVMALLAPNANSYRRLQPHSYVPLAPSWGFNNRTVAFRVPSGGASGRRIEHRAAGADANPYLIVASVLAGMLDGIERECVPPEPITGNAYELLDPAVPGNWGEALDLFARSDFARRSFGDRFVDLFHRVKTWERQSFERAVTPLELDWYLRTV